MIDFSALSSGKRSKKLAIGISVGVLLVVVLFITSIIVDQLDQQAQDKFMEWFTIGVLILIVPSVIAALIIPIVFVFKVTLPKILRYVSQGNPEYMPADSSQDMLQSFASDNKYSFSSYPYGKKMAPQYITEAFRIEPPDETYSLYEISGELPNGRLFDLYFLAIVENKRSIQSRKRRSGSYATNKFGKRVDYLTVAVIERDETVKVRRNINIFHQDTHTFAYAHGLIRDQGFMSQMFEAISIPRGA